MKKLFFIFLSLFLLFACNSQSNRRNSFYYTPEVRDDWETSIPQEEGIDPQLVEDLYINASELPGIYSLLVIKNGKLIGEAYFNGGSISKKSNMNSATKSFTSALAGIALEQGILESVDQKAIDFFPELEDQIQDPRKREITLEQLLQMRAGFPWEESTPELFALLYHGFKPSNFAEIPLSWDPGSRHKYSNLSSHFVGIMISRAAGTDLRSFAEENLLDPLGIHPGEWIQDWEGYYLAYGGCFMTARDMARFGQLYLDDGVYQGEQLLPSSWIDQSLQAYSNRAWNYRVGRNFRDIRYGYQWWKVRAGNYDYNLAWGHGGQQIALVRDLNLMVVVNAEPLLGEHGSNSWRQEKDHLNLVADFIASLPKE